MFVTFMNKRRFFKNLTTFNLTLMNASFSICKLSIYSPTPTIQFNHEGFIGVRKLAKEGQKHLKT